MAQSDIIINGSNATYQIESKPSGMYLVWYECEPGKWIGLAVVKTPANAHKVIKAHEEYLAKVYEVAEF